MYVSKNLVKSGILSYLSVLLSYQLYDLIVGREIDQLIFRYYGALYVGNDLAGLLFVRNLPNSTKLHLCQQFCYLQYCVPLTSINTQYVE